MTCVAADLEPFPEHLSAEFRADSPIGLRAREYGSPVIDAMTGLAPGSATVLRRVRVSGDPLLSHGVHPMRPARGAVYRGR